MVMTMQLAGSGCSRSKFAIAAKTLGSVTSPGRPEGETICRFLGSIWTWISDLYSAFEFRCW